MDTFRYLKLKKYFICMILGVSSILLGTGIAQSIVLEIFKEYDPASLTAYICGGAACAGICLFGLYELVQAFTFERCILKAFDQDERAVFLDELENHAVLAISGQAVLTEHYLLVSVKMPHFAQVIRKEDIIGCFRMERHHEADAMESEILLYDSAFKAISANVHGKGSVQAMERMYGRICEEMPWIYHEDYDDFFVKMRKIGYRRKMLKQMNDLKMRYETGYDSDIEAENELLAMSQDVKEKLNPHSLLERFLKRDKSV